MLSIAKITGGQAQNYFDKDDYFSREKTLNKNRTSEEWQGKLSKTNSFSDNFNVKEFEKEFVERMTLRHADALASIVSSGVVGDDTADVLRKEAEELVGLYTSD